MFLLSTQCLLDRITNVAPPSIDKLPAREIHVSTVSLAQAHLTIEQSPAAQRQSHSNALRSYVGMVRSFNNLVPFEEIAATLWASLRAQKLGAITQGGNLIPLSETSTMVVASVLAFRLNLVDYPQPYHQQVAGLNVVNP
jgi:hypothetical protein